MRRIWTKQTRWIASTVVAVLVLLGWSTQALPVSWEVTEMRVEARSTDDAWRVVEQIHVNFGRQARAGFERIIPVGRVDFGGPIVGVEVEAVRGPGGQLMPWSTETLPRGVAVRCGDPAALAVGEVTYELEYRLRGLTSQRGRRQELRWRLLGGDWPAQVLDLEVIVTLPAAVDLASVTTNSQVGSLSRPPRPAQVHTATKGAVRYRFARGVRPWEHVLVEAAWPSGESAVAQPTAGAAAAPAGGLAFRSGLALVVAFVALAVAALAHRRLPRSFD